MDLRQEALAHLGFFVLWGHFRGDIAGRDALVTDFLVTDPTVEDGSRVPLADAFAHAATVAVTACAGLSRRPFESALADLVEPAVPPLLPPPAGMPWDEAKALVATIPSGQGSREVAQEMDGPGAINATFAVAVAAFAELGRLAGNSPETFLAACLAKTPD